MRTRPRTPALATRLASAALATAAALAPTRAGAQAPADAPAADARSVLALEPPAQVGPYARGARRDFGGPALGVGYSYADPADGGRVRLNAYFYARGPETRALSAAAAVASEAASFRQALDYERARGLVDGYAIAGEGADTLLVSGAPGGPARAVPGYRVRVLLRGRGEALVSYYLVYAVGDGFVKVRGTVPAAGAEGRPVLPFARALVARSLGAEPLGVLPPSAAPADAVPADYVPAGVAPSPARALGPAEAVQGAAAAAPRGVRGTFELAVRGTGRADGLLFLNSERDYRDQRNLSVELDPAVEAALAARLGGDVGAALAGRTVRVTGVARRVKIVFSADGRPSDKYYYQTHLRVDSAAALELAR